jgi:hypothetical protein
MSGQRAWQPGDRIAVAVPTRDRPAHLAVLLAALATQTYPHWTLVVNDASTPPVETHDTVRGLLALLETRGHAPRLIRSTTGWDRHQRAMLAVPPAIELIVRIDDDLLPTPGFLEALLLPFQLLAEPRLAATGGCYPAPDMRPLPLERMLTDPIWRPRLADARWLTHGWRLQNHHYPERQLLEVDSLQGHAICYRRSAVSQVGGWAVEGYSSHAQREESDLCARLVTAGWSLWVTTEALAWHLAAESGGSRTVARTRHGVVLTSDPRPIESDERLFRARLELLQRAGRLPAQPLRRFALESTPAGPAAVPLKPPGLGHRLLRAYAWARRRLRPARRFIATRRDKS